MAYLFIFIISFTFCFSEDFGAINNNYKKARIKTQARKQTSNKRICYIYVDINGRRDWNKYKYRLNTQIQNNRSHCKKYIIYKVIKNVNTRNIYTSNSRNNNRSDYDINLGVIVEENSNVDIEIYTEVKNSKIRNGFNEQKSNTGIVVKKDDTFTDISNREYKVNTKIKNSKVGSLGVMNEFGLNLTKEFLKNDEDDLFK